MNSPDLFPFDKLLSETIAMDLEALTASAEQEIELAFLATYLPEDLDALTPVRITDIYLSDENDLLTSHKISRTVERACWLWLPASK